MGGTCYQDAWRFLIKEGEGELVHGTVQTIGRRISHAWVETETGYIWEPESGEFMKKDYFYSRALPKVEARYTAEEAAIMAARTKNFGPWTEEERRQYLKRKSPATAPGQLRSKYKVGDRVKSRVWTDVRGECPWLTVKGIYTAKWMGKPVVELEVTDGTQTNRVFEDTIIVHETITPARVVPAEKQPRRKMPGELEYFADSPEFLAYTIDDIGYRGRIDSAFQDAIRRARGGQGL
jgi:hypothetical protein